MIRVLTVAQLEPGHHWLGVNRGRVRTVDHLGHVVRVTFHGKTGTEDHDPAQEVVVSTAPHTEESQP